MPSIRIDITTDQKKHLDALGKKNMSAYIRQLIRDAHPDFPIDKEVGVRDDYTKMNLLGGILALITPHLPMGVETMQNVVMDWIIDNNTNSITREALVTLHTEGIHKLMDWLGMPPLYEDETKQVISVLRIKDGS